jgi:hypothetical protein
MQLRHIRPGSLEWQDAKADEVEQALELTPEETVRLRKLSDDRRLRQDDKEAQTQVQ